MEKVLATVVTALVLAAQPLMRPSTTAATAVVKRLGTVPIVNNKRGRGRPRKSTSGVLRSGSQATIARREARYAALHGGQYSVRATDADGTISYLLADNDGPENRPAETAINASAYLDDTTAAAAAACKTADRVIAIARTLAKKASKPGARKSTVDAGDKAAAAAFDAQCKRDRVHGIMDKHATAFSAWKGETADTDPDPEFRIGMVQLLSHSDRASGIYRPGVVIRSCSRDIPSAAYDDPRAAWIGASGIPATAAPRTAGACLSDEYLPGQESDYSTDCGGGMREYDGGISAVEDAIDAVAEHKCNTAKVAAFKDMQQTATHAAAYRLRDNPPRRPPIEPREILRAWLPVRASL